MPRRTSAQAKLTADEVPAGAKQITRTTTERFQAPIGGEAELDAELESADAVLEVDESDDELELLEEPPKTALDSVLASLKGIGEITIYVIRKPDPIGVTFANPSNMSHTAGDLPFDETFTSKEAIELAVQSVYGGGKYQLQIRENGDYKAAWTTMIADPRKRLDANQPPQPQFSPNGPATSLPARTAREELMDVIDLAERMANIRNNGAQQQTRELPPADPLKAARETMSLLENAKNLFDRGEPATVVGGDRHWTDGVANLVDKLGIGTLISEGGKIVVAEWMKVKKAEVEAAVMSQTANAVGQQQPQQPHPTALQNAPPVAEPPQQPIDTADTTLSAEEMQVLSVVVHEIGAFENDEDNEQLENRVARAVAALRTLPPERLALVMLVPPAFVVPYLIGLREDWKDLAEMTDAGAFVGLLVEKLREEPEEQGSDVAAQFRGPEEEKEDGEQEKEDATARAPKG